MASLLGVIRARVVLPHAPLFHVIKPRLQVSVVLDIYRTAFRYRCTLVDSSITSTNQNINKLPRTPTIQPIEQGNKHD
jgi:hypothetical protein